MLGVLAVLFLIFTLLRDSNRATIHYSDLERLIELGPTKDSGDVETADAPPTDDDGAKPSDASAAQATTVAEYITIERFDGANRAAAVGNLRDLKIGPDEITGLVDFFGYVDPTTGDLETVASVEDRKQQFRTARLGLAQDNGYLQELLRKHGFDYRADEPPSGLQFWGPLILISLVFLLALVVMMRRLGGAGSPMAFGRSRGKMYAQEDIGITFEDVAGIEEAVDELREVVEFLRNPDKYQRLWRTAYLRACCWWGHPAPAKPCWPRRSPARRAFPSSASRDLTSSKCSSASVRHASATCSNKPRPSRPPSFSSTSWTR